MPDDLKASAKSSIGKDYISWPNIERAAKIALQHRRDTGEIMTYLQDGWVVREYPGQRVVRLAPVGTFKAEDFPVEE